MNKFRLDHEIIFQEEKGGGEEAGGIHTNPERLGNFKPPFLFLKSVFTIGNELLLREAR